MKIIIKIMIGAAINIASAFIIGAAIQELPIRIRLIMALSCVGMIIGGTIMGLAINSEEDGVD